MGINPFDRVGLGWDGLFSPGTLFYHLHPNVSTSVTNVDADANADRERVMMVEKIQVPVLRIGGGGGGLLEDVHSIGMVTLIVVIFGFLWVFESLRSVVKKGGLGSGDDRRVLKGKKRE